MIVSRVNRLQRLRDGRGDLVRREWAPPAVAAALGIDPAVEVAAQRLAAAHGLAPPVIDFDPQARCMLMPFIDGTPLEADWARLPARREAMREVLVRLRAIEAASLPGIDLTERVCALHERLARIDAAAGQRWQPQLERSLLDARRLASASTPAAGGGVLVHGDLIPQNVIVRGDGSLCLIDWEYAHQGHGDEDLAGLAALSATADTVTAEVAGWSLEPGNFGVRRQLRRLLDGLWLELASACPPAG